MKEMYAQKSPFIIEYIDWTTFTRKKYLMLPLFCIHNPSRASDYEILKMNNYAVIITKMPDVTALTDLKKNTVKNCCMAYRYLSLNMD